jgi:apolipoprotein N-acyltransferase
MTLSFAPYDHGWLVWVAFAPMIVAQYRVLPAVWSALGPAIGIGGFMAGYFGGAFFPERAAWYMKMLPLIVAGVAFLTSRRRRATRERAGYATWPLAAATTWVALDLVRAHIPALGTWGFFGYALYRQTWFIQPVRVFGIFGLDLLVVLVNYSIAMAVIARLDKGGVFPAPVAIVPRHAGLWCLGVLLVLAGWCAFSLSSGDRGDPTVRVAVLQPGVRPRDVGTTPDARDRAMLDRLAAQTREAASRGARLVVWPEAMLAADPALAYRSEVGGLAKDTATTLVVGYAIRLPAGTRNEAVTVDPEGDFVGRFGKDHPVVFFGGTSLSRGAYPTVDAGFGRMGTMICNDMHYTDTARELARRGAKILAVPSSDWAAIAAKASMHSVFRALETGAVVAKSEYSVDSAIVDGYGRIAASALTPSGSEAVLVADVPIRDGEPLATRLGDWVGWSCVAGTIGRMLWARRRRGARTRTESPQSSAGDSADSTATSQRAVPDQV